MFVYLKGSIQTSLGCGEHQNTKHYLHIYHKVYGYVLYTYHNS